SKLSSFIISQMEQASPLPPSSSSSSSSSSSASDHPDDQTSGQPQHQEQNSFNNQQQKSSTDLIPATIDDNILKRELYFLIYKFLERSPLQQSFQVLKHELESNACLLPPQYDWRTGSERSSNEFGLGNEILELAIKQHPHITADYLFQSLKQAHQALSQVVPPPIENSIVSFLSAGRFSLVRPIPKKSLISEQDERLLPLNRNPFSLASISNHRNHAPPLLSQRFSSVHFPGHISQTLFSRQLAGPKPITHLLPVGFYEQYQKYNRVLGHLSSVFCVLFDRTGRFLITGADDTIIKIWSASDGRLLATLRGHQGEITDLSISLENDMLASGSCDKKIRVWNLRTTALIKTLKNHEDQISGVKFCPLMTQDTRYLVSISQDGSVCFYKYDAKTRLFQDDPIRFVERKRRDSQLVSCSFSAGGAFFAVGSTDCSLYVYHVSAPAGPTKILEIEQHTDHVDSLQFSNRSMLRFISSGRDGLAHIWNYEKQKWNHLKIDINQRLDGRPPERRVEIAGTSKICVLRVCMVAWTIDDRFVITSLTDSSIKVWFSHNAKLKHVLYGHEDEVYIIEPHPTDGRIILTAGHEGAIMIWDVVTGTNIKTFYNALENSQVPASLFDAKWNPDGTMFAATDSYGHLILFGLSPSNPYSELPEHMFFHTDYRPIIRDANDFVIDEQMQIAPHLMPPPFLVDIDGNPYPPRLQRLVPGRENCHDPQLIPFDGGDQQNDQQAQQQQQQGALTIDDMIQRLQREQQQRRPSSSGDITAPTSGSSPANSSRSAHSVGDGVRNAANLVDPNDRVVNDESSTGRPSGFQMGIFMRKPLIIPLPEREIEFIRERQCSLNKMEEEYYRTEQKKRPKEIEPIEPLPEFKPFTRRQRRILYQSSGVTRSSSRSNRSNMNNSDRTERQFSLVPLDEDDSNDEDFTGTSEEESSESDDATSDSDWNQPSTSRDRTPFPSSVAGVSSAPAVRKRKRRATDVEDDDHIQSDNDDQHDTSNDIIFLNQPSTSLGNEGSIRSRRRTNIDDIHNPLERRQRFEQINVDHQFRQVENGHLDEQFRPPEWFTNSKPKRTPYFPQIGDRVVYFRQGHQKYIDAVRETKCYNINLATKPFRLRGSDSDEIFAKIIGIQYHVKPPRLVTLRMVVIDPLAEENEAEQQQTSNVNQSSSNHHPHIAQQQFSVRYHDLDHVCDFIILKQWYDISVSREWRVADLFRSAIDDQWWIGRIHSMRYTETNSYFQSIEVIWCNGEKELLSPWDLEPLESNLDIPNQPPNDGQSVTDEERIAFSMIDEQEWPLEQRNRDRERIINGLLRVMEFSHAEEFAAPVDLNQHPLYAMTIPYPMDLSTIMSRLRSNFYRRLEAVKFDVRFIESNAALYNMPESLIVKKAKIITECCLRFIEDSECQDPTPIMNELSNNYASELVNATGISTTADPTQQQHSSSMSSSFGHQRPRRSTRRIRSSIFSDSDVDEINRPGRPSRSDRTNHIHNRLITEHDDDNRPRKTWKQLCRELIDQIFELPDSEPFRAPVDPIIYPNYAHIIDTPMDLTTVKEQLLADIYDSPQDFAKDMRLIFTNSKQFNTSKKSRIYSMTIRLSNIFEEKMRSLMSELKSSRSRTNRQSSNGGRSGRNRRNGKLRNTSRFQRKSSSPMSPTIISPYEQQLTGPSTSRRRCFSQQLMIIDSNQPSTSSIPSNYYNQQQQQQRSSHRISKYYYESNSMEKYGLRHRRKRIRTYKEDDSNEDFDDEESTGCSQKNSSSRTGTRRPIRAAARKRVNYGENDSDSDDDLAVNQIRERNANIRLTHQQPRPAPTVFIDSFASNNESSRESTMSSNSNRSDGSINRVGRRAARRRNGHDNDEDDDDSNHQSSSGLRRSTRKIQPKRRYSSDSADEQFHQQLKSRIRRSRTYQKHYDGRVGLAF
ncbi:Bromodomain and WD repeat-containing protein 3, partial [Dermatophagoides pteronyssinus]